jgi:signal peptidase I
VRKTGLLTLMLILPLLASCGAADKAAGEKRYKVPNAAMEPTIKQNSAVTSTAVEPGSYKPADGDIVMIKIPANWAESGMLLLRVVGVPGETIECCDGKHGQLKRNGQWADEPYLSEQGQSAAFDPVKVPAGNVYLMEDNRGRSNDSAQHGPAPVDAVVGVVKLG